MLHSKPTAFVSPLAAANVKMPDAVSGAGCEVTTGASGAATTCQLIVAGTLALPSESVWRTSNVWRPSARPESVAGLVQGAKEPASSLHANVAPATPLNSIEAAVEMVVAVGRAVTVGTGGGMRATIQLIGPAAGPVWALESIARTANVWVPSRSPGSRSTPLAHAM